MMERPHFIEGTDIQWAWDSFSLSCLKKCPQYYKYTIVDGWRQREQSTHLLFGQLYHSGLEQFDRRIHEGMDRQEAIHNMVVETVNSSRKMEPIKSKSRESLVRSLIWYTERWQGNREAIQLATLQSGTPALELSFQWQSDLPVAEVSPQITYRFCGHFDKLGVYQNIPLVVDRKTTKSTLGSYYFEQFTPNNQMSFYPFMAERVYSIPMRGVLVDAVQVAVTFSEFSRQVAYRTPDQQQEWWEEVQGWLRQSVHYALEGKWPMNDEACRGCAFRGICSKDPSVRPAFLATNFIKQPWNPLEARTPGQEPLSLYE